MEDNNELKDQMCACCKLYPVILVFILSNLPKGEQIKLRESLDCLNSHKSLRSGYVLYFGFIKCLIYLFLLMFIISGLYSIITNVVSKDCSHVEEGNDSYCIRDFKTMFSIANKRNKEGLLKAQLSVNLVVLIGIILFFHYIRYQFRKVIVVEDLELTPSDYTLRLDRVKASDDNVTLVNSFESLSTPEQKINVVKLTRTYKITEFIHACKRINQLNKLIEKAKDPIKKEMLTMELNEITKRKEELKNQPLEYGDVAFVTLETPEQAQALRKLLSHKTLLTRLITKLWSFNRKKVSRAPEPNEVIWENMSVPVKMKLRIRLVSYTLTLILMGSSLGLIVLLNSLQVNLNF